MSDEAEPTPDTDTEQPAVESAPDEGDEMGDTTRYRKGRRIIAGILLTFSEAERERMLTDLLMSEVDYTVAAIGLPCASQELPEREPQTLKRRIVALLTRNPRMPIERITRSLYGDAELPNRASVRSMLSQLKKAGSLRVVGHGEWVVAR